MADDGTGHQGPTAGGARVQPCEHGAAGSLPEVRTETLSLGGQLFIWSARRWRVAMEQGESVDDALAYTYGIARCPEAVALLDETMSLVAVAASRPVTIRCVRCPTLSDDERDLLRALQDLQRGRVEHAAEQVARIVAGRLRHAFCRSATVYADALDAADVPLVAKLELVT